MLVNYKNQQLIDIFVSGYSEKNNSYLEFSPMYWWVYLKFDSKYIILNANYGNITISEENKIKCYFDIEENDYFTIFSISKIGYSKVVDIDRFYDKEKNLIQIGVQIENLYILFDSLTVDGFFIGEYKSKTEALDYINENY